MLYNLYKSIFTLSRKNKEFLHNSFDNVIASIKEEKEDRVVVARNIKEAMVIDAKNDVFKQVVAGGLHDPETPEEMCNLIGLLEKFVGIDNNISHDNIGIFISPMSMGAKKIMLRPCRIVGLIRKLDRLSRQHKRDCTIEGFDHSESISNFHNNLKEVKERLNGFKKPLM